MSPIRCRGAAVDLDALGLDARRRGLPRSPLLGDVSHETDFSRFAGALRELGLPRSEFLTALLAFNTGVEAGQLAVIAAATVLIAWRWSPRIWYRRRIVVPASALIAVTALYWTIARFGI